MFFSRQDDVVVNKQEVSLLNLLFFSKKSYFFSRIFKENLLLPMRSFFSEKKGPKCENFIDFLHPIFEFKIRKQRIGGQLFEIELKNMLKTRENTPLRCSI